MDRDFEETYRLVAPSAQRLALVLTGGNQQDADDLVQTVFERMYLRWSRLDVVDPVAYVRASLVRQHSSHFRRAYYRREVPIGTQEHGAVDTDVTDQNLRMDLLRALRRLPYRQRQALALRYLEDLPVVEVSRLMRCSDGAVKRSCHDGLNALRAMAQPEETKR